MDFVAEIKKKIDPVCRHYDVDKVFLFGSYARGVSFHGNRCVGCAIWLHITMDM